MYDEPHIAMTPSSACTSDVSFAPSRSTGKERDLETGGLNGSDYFESRYYASNIGGRFLTPDDGSAQDSSDPQSWNLYSYVQNNPLTNIDPDGHDLESIAVNCYVSTSSSTVTTSEGGSWKDFTSTPWCLEVQKVQRTIQTLSKLAWQAIQQVGNYATAPRDPGCMNAFAAAGAVTGAARGAYLGAGAGGAAGAALALPTGETADIATVPGGAAFGGLAGAAAGGELGGVAGAATGYFACASGGRGGNGGGNFDRNNPAHRKMTANSIISKFKRGSIRSVFPSEKLDLTYETIEAQAKSGDPAAQTAVKLLTDGRFNK